MAPPTSCAHGYEEYDVSNVFLQFKSLPSHKISSTVAPDYIQHPITFFQHPISSVLLHSYVYEVQNHFVVFYSLNATGSILHFILSEFSDCTGNISLVLKQLLIWLPKIIVSAHLNVSYKLSNMMMCNIRSTPDVHIVEVKISDKKKKPPETVWRSNIPTECAALRRRCVFYVDSCWNTPRAG